MQKSLLKIFLTLALILTYSSSLACDIERDFIDRNFGEIAGRYRMDKEFYDNKFFQTHTRAKSIRCSEVPSDHVDIIFVEGKLAQIIFENRSENTELLEYSKSKFGNFYHPLNEKTETNRDYADYRDNNKIIVSYSKAKLIDNLIKETLVITSKALAEKLHELQKEVENE